MNGDCPFCGLGRAACDCVRLTARRPVQLGLGIICRAAEHGLVVKLDDDTRETFDVPPGRYRVIRIFRGRSFVLQPCPPRFRGAFTGWLDGEPKEV